MDYPYIDGKPMFLSNVDDDTAKSLLPIIKAIMQKVVASKISELHPYALLPFPTIKVQHEDINVE